MTSRIMNTNFADEADAAWSSRHAGAARSAAAQPGGPSAHHPEWKWTNADAEEAETAAKELEGDSPFRSLILGLSARRAAAERR